MIPNKPTQSRTPKGRKLPKGQAMFVYYKDGDGLFVAPKKPRSPTYPCAVIPCRTKREAAQVVKMHSLETLPTYEECEAASDDGTATPLQEFIYNFEPGDGFEELCFRSKLAEVLNLPTHD